MSMIRLRITFLAAVALIAGAAVVQQSARAADKPPLIPRDALFGNPDKAAVQLSPDGQHISYLASVNGVLNVWVGPVGNPEAAKPVTKDTHRGIRIYFWAYTSEHIIYMQDTGGDEDWHIYSVNLRNDNIRDLTPFEKVAARVQEVSQDYPEEILVRINNRNPQFHDVHRVNITTGDMSLVLQNDEGYVGYLSEDDLKIHFAVKMTPDGGSEIHKATGPNSWTLFAKIPATDSLTTSPLFMDESGKNLFMLDSRGRNTAALMLVDIASGQSKTLAEDPKADMDGIIGHPTKNIVQAVSSTYLRRRWQILDKSIEGDIRVLEKVTDGDFNVTSRTLDDRHWIVAYVVDAGPVRYYKYDRKTKKATFLFTNRKALEKFTLAKMYSHVVKSRDGLNLVSYYTLPTWSDPDQDGRPDKPLPMVLSVHGGPWGRDSWGYDSWHQWLANRGYAVLSVNFRGSTGFGKNFINASNFEWAGKMHDDLIDAVEWATKNGIANEKKVAIMGGSYGGYAALVGLTFTPDTFACGVDIVGPSNLITLLSTIPPYWAPMIELFTKRVGDHRTEEGRALLAERSPLNRVDQIRKPLLIGQGANDPRVKQAEADQIVDAMKKKNLPVTYVLFPDEGHGFARPENRTSFNAVTEAFLSKHLGGRFEPMSEDLAGSSITIPEGAEHVPGLPKTIDTKGTTAED